MSLAIELHCSMLTRITGSGMVTECYPVSLRYLRNCTGLKPNTNKTEVMICHPGKIQDRCSIEGYKRRHEGTGGTYNKGGCLRVKCHVCDTELSAGSLKSHLRTQHGIDGSGSIVIDPATLAPRSYKLSFVQTARTPHERIPCPADGCQYQAKAASLLRRHFFNRHPTFQLHIEQDGNVPRFCKLCGILVSLHSLRRGHEGSTSCKTNVRRNQQRECKQAAAAAQAWVSTIDGIELKKVENFKYLGRQISSRDSDFPALFLNLSKARKRLVRISGYSRGKELLQKLVGNSMWLQSYRYCCMDRNPGCGLCVCLTPYEAFIIALFGILLG